MFPPQPELVRRWIEHLCAEEAALLAVRIALTDLNNALRGPSAAVAFPAGRLASAVAELQNLDAARTAVRHLAGQVLAIPIDQITVSTLAIALPSDCAQLLACQQRLRELHAEIVRLARRSATMVIYCRSFTQRILTEMVGLKGTVERYGPSGQHLGTPLTGVVQGAV